MVKKTQTSFEALSLNSSTETLFFEKIEFINSCEENLPVFYFPIPFSFKIHTGEFHFFVCEGI